MRIRIATCVALCLVTPWTTVESFAPRHSAISRTSSALFMVLEKPKIKEIAKIEQLKLDSNYLIHPLKEVRLAMRVIFLVGVLCNTYRSDEYDSFPV
jgi:hypothetical protein